MSIHTELKAALEKGGEREITKVLKKNPLVILWCFAWTGGHSKYILHEFSFGNRYRADFVVLLSYSGNWEVYFIELENTDDNVITKSGRPSQRLNSAISQVNDWNQFVEDNKRLVQEDLARACKEKDILQIHTHGEPTNYSGNYLKDPNTRVRFKYHIIIGRRDNATEEIRNKMNQLSFNGLAQINTFDKFLDVATNIDQFHSNPNEPVDLTKSFGV